MKICRRAGSVSVVSEREVLVRFVTLVDDVTARNISEWHKIMEKRCQEEKEKLWLGHVLKDILWKPMNCVCLYTG